MTVVVARAKVAGYGEGVYRDEGKSRRAGREQHGEGGPPK